MLGSSCIGIDKHLNAIKDELESAIQARAHIFENDRDTESGVLRKLRSRSETANLQTIANTSAAMLEQGLRDIATMMGLNSEDIVVTAPTDLLDATLTP